MLLTSSQMEHCIFNLCNGSAQFFIDDGSDDLIPLSAVRAPVSPGYCDKGCCVEPSFEEVVVLLKLHEPCLSG